MQMVSVNVLAQFVVHYVFRWLCCLDSNSHSDMAKSSFPKPLQTRRKVRRPGPKRKSHWSCPYDDETDPKRVPCNMCDVVCRSWSAIKKHLMNVHHLKACDIRGTYIQKQLTTSKAKTASMSDLEFASVGVAQGVPQSFVCKLCDGQVYKKCTAFKHFQKYHADIVDKVTLCSWVVVKDENRIRNTSSKQVLEFFEDASAKYTAEHPGSDVCPVAGGQADTGAKPSDIGLDDQLCGAKMICDTLVKVPQSIALHLFACGLALDPEVQQLVLPTAQADVSGLAALQSPVDQQAADIPASSDLAAILRDIRAMMSNFTSGASRIEVQKLEICTEHAEWEQPAGWNSKLRRNFPFREQEAFHHDEFDKFMNVRRLKCGTRNIYMKGLGRFVSMIRTSDGSELDVENILVNVFRCGLFQKLLSLPILSCEYSCTRQTAFALGHFATMCKLRYQGKGDADGAQSIDQLSIGHLVPWSRRCSACQREASKAKYNADALLLAEYHSAAELKSIAFMQYLDLLTIHRVVCEDKTQSLTPIMLFKATACVVVGFYTNAQPGRSMELETLPRAVIDTFLDTDHDFFAYSNYKTVKVYGTGGKWVNAANRKALMLYRDIIDSAPELCSECPDGIRFFLQKQIISVATCLRSVSLAEGLNPPLKVNLLRKVYNNVSLNSLGRWVGERIGSAMLHFDTVANIATWDGVSARG